MKLKLPITLIIALYFAACNNKQHESKNLENVNDRLLVSVAWVQNSAEYTALYYQGFNIATERLNGAIASNKQNKQLAVVVDIDETMLNNSPFDASLILNSKNPMGWKDWTSKASAKALPGALEFAKYAQNKGVGIFYITNRDDSEHAATVKNLQMLDFPYATDDHVLTKSDLSLSTGNTSSKKGRREIVAKDYEIILLIGDNLNDFSEIFEDRSMNNGKEAVELNRELFGQKFIILPNPVYGAWEKPLYNYNDSISELDKIQLLKSKLITE